MEWTTDTITTTQTIIVKLSITKFISVMKIIEVTTSNAHEPTLLYGQNLEEGGKNKLCLRYALGIKLNQI